MHDTSHEPDGTPRDGDRGQAPCRLTGRLGREMRTISRMVRIYCRDHHGGPPDGTCSDCAAFLVYAERRLVKCPYGADKPTCSNCPIHCYKPEPRQFAHEMMRYSGPRMTLRHPWLALMHLLDGRRRVEHPMAARRRQR